MKPLARNVTVKCYSPTAQVSALHVFAAPPATKMFQSAIFVKLTGTVTDESIWRAGFIGHSASKFDENHQYETFWLLEKPKTLGGRIGRWGYNI